MRKRKRMTENGMWKGEREREREREKETEIAR